MKIIKLLFLIFFVFKQVQSAKILGLFSSPSKSHLTISMGVVEILIERGHNVTVVTTIPLDGIIKKPLESSDEKERIKTRSFRHILVNFSNKIFENKIYNEITETYSNKSFEDSLQYTFSLFVKFMIITNATINDENVKKLMNEENFDLFLSEYNFNDFNLGIAANFKCPVVLIWNLKPFSNINKMFGNPNELSYTPYSSLNISYHKTIRERTQNFCCRFFEFFIKKFLDLLVQKYYELNFSSDNYPKLEKIHDNVSLILVHNIKRKGNNYPSAPAIIEIGGVHIKENSDPLPLEILEFLDTANFTGAIYVNFGSNFETQIFEVKAMKTIFEALSSVSQKVIWKWDVNNSYPGYSKNIIYSKLLTHHILSHPNIKMFITHGDKNTLIEAQYYGVPMIVIPVHGEQFLNAKFIFKHKIGAVLYYNRINLKLIKSAISEILFNEIYYNNMKKFAKLSKNRTISIQKNTLFWIEFVLHKHGSHNLRYPSNVINFVQSYNLDIIAVIILTFHSLKKLFEFIKNNISIEIYNIVNGLDYNDDYHIDENGDGNDDDYENDDDDYYSDFHSDNQSDSDYYDDYYGFYHRNNINEN